MREASGMPVDVEVGLADGRLADEQAGVVHVVVHAALDAAGIGLHEHAVALGRLDVEPDVVEVGRVEAEHGDVAEDDLAVGGGRAGGGEGAAVLGCGRAARPRGGLAEALRPPGRSAWLEGGVEGVDLDARQLSATMSSEVERPAVERGPGGGGAVGDALHLLEVFRVEPAQEQGVDQRAHVAASASAGALRLRMAAKQRRRKPAISGASSRPC